MAKAPKEQLRRLLEKMRQQGQPAQTIESGRVGVPQGRPLGEKEFEDLIKLLPNKAARDRATRLLLAAREADRTQRQAKAEAIGRETARITGAQAQEAQAHAVEAEPFPIPAGAETAPTGETGIKILFGTENTPPHTYTTKAGKHCATDRWFNDVFLCYDAGLAKGDRGGMYDPWLGLAGRNFRCYYPNSTAADFRSIMTSGSSGRWLHMWTQKSNYVRF